MLEEKKLESKNMEDESTVLGRSLFTGFIGGIIWGSIGWFLYYFNFMEVSAKSYLLRSWTTAGWTETWLGELLTILLLGIISIGVALVYYGIFKKVYSIWMGIAYGIMLWAVVFFVLQPIFTNVPNLGELEMKTVVTTICLYILYGTFIGYSISYDYHDTLVGQKEEPKTK